MDLTDALTIFNLTVNVFVALLGIALLAIVLMYIIDRRQTAHAVRRNFPVIGRFRYLFEHIGEFFRQYFFAMDREEMPFNRAERSWVYRAAKNEDSTVAFGSTRDLRPVGTVLFVNCPYPKLEEEALDTSQFVRVHRRFILNVTELAKLEKYGKESYIAVLKDNQQISVSLSGYGKLKEMLDLN